MTVDAESVPSPMFPFWPPLGDSGKLRVGDYVVAIADPYGLGQTATFRIVSALGRTGLGIAGYEDFIQTDASINPGNSGGALADMTGHLIGINTAIVSGGGGNVGIGFAIPSDMVRDVAQQLITAGKVSRGELGVTVQDLTPTLAQAMGIKITGGALVSQILPNSPAAKAGITRGDVITELDGAPIVDSAQLRNEIDLKKPGTMVQLARLHNGRQRTVMATLEALASGKIAPASAAQQTTPEVGLTLSPILPNDPSYGKVVGVYVAGVDPESAADEAGIRRGDIIVSAGQMPVSSPAKLARIVQERKRGTPLLLLIRRGNASLYMALQ
jgi:serine protease DegQ